MTDKLFSSADLAAWEKAAAKSAPNGDVSALTWNTPEGIAVKPLYTKRDTEGLPHADTLPGFEPFLRGPHATMYVNQPWTIRQYAGFSTAEESIYDRPFQWGSKRTGPDLARVGGKYSDDWQRLHLMDPRALVPQSNMPGYPWLATARVDGADIAARMRALRTLGDPYTEADIAGAAKEVDGKTELDALVAYLQGLGIANEPQTAQAAAAPIAGNSP